MFKLTWVGEDLPNGIEELIEITLDGGFEIAGMQLLLGETRFQLLVSGKVQIAAVISRSTHDEF